MNLKLKDKIENICKEKGITVAELARNADIPKTTLYSMINREGSARIDNIIKICEATDVKLNDFLNEESDERVTMLIRKIEKMKEDDKEHLLTMIEGAIFAISKKRGISI